jgi:hypothetical protein
MEAVHTLAGFFSVSEGDANGYALETETLAYAVDEKSPV